MSFTASLSQIITDNENGLLGAHASWERVPLREVATILNGFPFPSSAFSSAEGTPLLRIRDVLRSRTETYVAGEVEPQYCVQPGDLVVGMDGDFNSSIWRGPVAALNQRVCKITPNERFFSLKLLSYVLPGYLSAINSATSAITVKHLSSRTVEDIPLPLPPRQEQDRIVAEIEQQFTRLDAAVAALRRARANLRRYRAAVLAAACSGRLVPTEAALARAEGREYEPADALLARTLNFLGSRTRHGEPASRPTAGHASLPEGWSTASVEMLSCLIQYGTSAKTSADETGSPVIRMGNIIDGGLKFDDLKYLPLNHHEFPQLLLAPGDVLFNRTNSAELVGKTAVYRGHPSPCSFASYLIRVRLCDGYLPDMLAYYINSGLGRSWIKTVVNQQVGQANVNGSKLRALVVPVPPLAEQERIVAEVERRLSVADEAEAQIAANLARAERLRQAILKRAFAGRLVPQDPADEPASVLLARIKVERAAFAPAGRRAASRRTGGGPRATGGRPPSQPRLL